MPVAFPVVSTFELVCRINRCRMSHVMFPTTHLILFVIATSGLLAAQSSSPEPLIQKPGVTQVQVPFAELRRSATFKIGGTADGFWSPMMRSG